MRISLLMSGAALLLLPAFLFFFFPVSYVWLGTEDGLVEFSSALFFLTSSALFLHRFLSTQTHKKYGVLLFSIGCFVLGMEEISWGQRILGITPPEFFIENNLQNETNLHNLFNHRRFLKIFLVGIFVWSFIYPFMVERKICYTDKLQNLLGIPLPGKIERLLFLLASIFLVKDFPPRGEEYYEAFLAVLFFSVSATHLRSKATHAKLYITILGFSILLTYLYLQEAVYIRGMENTAINGYSRLDLCTQSLALHEAARDKKGSLFWNNIAGLRIRDRMGIEQGDELKRLTSVYLKNGNEFAYLQATSAAGKTPAYKFDLTDVLSDWPEIRIQNTIIKNQSLKDYAFARQLLTAWKNRDGGVSCDACWDLSSEQNDHLQLESQEKPITCRY